MTSIEPTLGPINDTCVFKASGLMLLALNSSQIPSYFLPALGPAPKWCSYLENLTVSFWTLFSFVFFCLGSWICNTNNFSLNVGGVGGECTNNNIWWFQVLNERRTWEAKFDKPDWDKSAKSLPSRFLYWLSAV